MSDDPELKRIRWRCRRGMRELDQLFDRYLARCWTTESEPQRVVFLRLLDCEDDKLWRWFMGYEQCPDAELAAPAAPADALELGIVAHAAARARSMRTHNATSARVASA
jgi:antitoxin CptB